MEIKHSAKKNARLEKRANQEQKKNRTEQKRREENKIERKIEGGEDGGSYAKKMKKRIGKKFKINPPMLDLRHKRLISIHPRQAIFAYSLGTSKVKIARSRNTTRQEK